MSRFFTLVLRFISMLHREDVFRILAIVILLALAGSLGMAYFEPGLSYGDALWWALVTLTTVGYGDISPSTAGGRMVGGILMIGGIGLLGVLTAGIAGIFVEHRFLENKGMKPVRVENHFIICGWNFRGRHIVEELRADAKAAKAPIVLIANIPEKPMDDPNLHFIHGDADTGTLKMACVETAQSAIILSDDRIDSRNRDAHAILTTLTIENLNPEVYTCVELVDGKNEKHCRWANANEVIVAGELSTNLLVQAAVDHGMSRMISELVSNRKGEDLYKIPVPERLIDSLFIDVLITLKKEHGVICMGVLNAQGDQMTANPDAEYRVTREDSLVVIAPCRPSIS